MRQALHCTGTTPDSTVYRGRWSIAPARAIPSTKCNRWQEVPENMTRTSKEPRGRLKDKNWSNRNVNVRTLLRIEYLTQVPVVEMEFKVQTIEINWNGSIPNLFGRTPTLIPGFISLQRINSLTTRTRTTQSTQSAVRSPCLLASPSSLRSNEMLQTLASCLPLPHPGSCYDPIHTMHGHLHDLPACTAIANDLVAT